MQGGPLQEGIFNKGELKNRVIFEIRGVSVSLGIKASQIAHVAVHVRNVGMTKWRVEPIAIIVNQIFWI